MFRGTRALARSGTRLRLFSYYEKKQTEIDYTASLYEIWHIMSNIILEIIKWFVMESD